MENTASCKCNVRHFQWLALALWVWPELVNLINNLCKLFGCNNLLNLDWNTPAYYVYQTTVALTITASLILLSKLAAKPATTIVLRRVALPIMAIGLLSVYFEFYKLNIGISSNITVRGVLSLIFLTKTTMLLYIFGVIDRENKEHKEGCRALYGYFLVSYIITWLVGNSFMFIQSIEVIYVLKIILSLTSLFFVYKFLTSAIFCGEKSFEPIEKGAFKFWNKFFTQFIIIFFGGILLLGILGITIN